MTEEIRVELGSHCSLEAFIYEDKSIKPDVWIEYIERSSDHWCGDTITTVDIEREDAVKIVELLRKVYSIE